ncbi:hypothetical protein Tco_0606843 [Tanacetum coccineum]
MLEEVCFCCTAISPWVEFCYSSLARLYYGEHTLWLRPSTFLFSVTSLICKIRDSFSLSLHVWYLDDGTIIGDTFVVGKVLELIMEDGPCCSFHLNVDKTKVFLPKEEVRSRLAGVFLPNTARPLHGVKLLGGPASVDFNFSSELMARSGFDADLRTTLERIVTTCGHGFADSKQSNSIVFYTSKVPTSQIRQARVFPSKRRSSKIVSKSRKQESTSKETEWQARKQLIDEKQKITLKEMHELERQEERLRAKKHFSSQKTPTFCD